MSLSISNRPEFRILRSIFSLAIALSPAILLSQGGDPVPNYVVNTTADDATGTAANCTSSPEGVCTLRDALAAAAAESGSNITFDPTVFLATNSAAANTITLANGVLNIPSNTTITGLTIGSGATLTNLITVSGNNATTVFTVASSVTGAVIVSMNITNGSSAGDAGGISNSGELTVTGSAFTGNSASPEYLGHGGAIYNSGSGVLTVASSIFSHNSAQFGGAIETEGVLAVSGSTFSGNSAWGGGAILGLCWPCSSNFPGVRVTGSTFGGNSASFGGAISMLGADLTVAGSTLSGNKATIEGGGISGAGTLIASNNIMEGNLVGSGGSYPDIDSSPLNDLGGNLINTSASATVVNPNLASLSNRGGPTHTMLPEPGSSAICGGIAANIPAGVTFDQRGYPIENTTYPGYSSSTPCVDSGAVQTHYAMAFTTQPPANATVNEAIAPAPVVTLTESGNPVRGITGTVRMTDSSNALSGVTSESLILGKAAFVGLEFPSEVNDDIFTATLELNPMLSLSAQASVRVTAVTATGPDPATMLSPTPGTATVLGTSNILFQWSTGVGITSYELLIGTNGVGTSDILATAPLAATSYTVPSLPANGVTLFVRLSSLINGAWQNEDYVYTESGTEIAATLSPSSGALTASQTFSWNNGNDATYYQLTVGTTGPGSTDILGTGITTETSATVSIPTNGATVYATLYQFVDGAWRGTDYTFTAPALYVVNTAADDATGTASNCTSSPEGICTLRDALAAASAVAGSIVTFDPTVFLASNSAAANTITLGNGTLNIPSNANITGLTTGSGATLTNLVTVSGNNATRVFNVASGVTGAVIANLNIVNGSNADGEGGGIADPGQLTVTGSTFSGDTAMHGGAIACNGGTLIVRASTFTGNGGSQNPFGGAIFTNGGVLTVTGSTFSGNSGSLGGAIGINGSSATITNSTISGNSTGFLGGGVFISGGPLNISNSIVEGNTALSGGINPDIDIDERATLNDLGGNLINTSASLTFVNPNLSPLGNYGGPFQTMLPEPGSAAICGGLVANIPAGVTTDQRGYPIENTTYPGYSSSTPCVDSGAVQTNYAMAFTTQPPASVTFNEAITPAPVVTVIENGNPALAATGNVTMTDSAGLLSGTTSEGLSLSTASFPGLILAEVATDDIFTAWLELNPSLNISAQASVEVTTPTPDLAFILSPTPGTATILGTSNILFQWTSGSGVTSYELLIGTNGVGSSNILNTGVLNTTSYTVLALPADGVTLYVRLSSLLNGAWLTEDYQYTESAPAAMLSPTPGTATILGASNILFQWSKGLGVTSYELLIGTSGVGSSNILAAAPLTTTSYTVPALPANRATLYVRLGSLFNGGWQTEDYVYTESGPATLSPSSGTLSTSQLFTWDNATEAVSDYLFVVRSEGPGSPILIDTGVTTATSATVAIPANGATIIATLYQTRFYQYQQANWQETEYTFTAPGTRTPATLTPASGTLSTSQNFDWSNGNEARYFQFMVFSNGPGSPELFHSGLTMETSATVNIPANGATVTVWLYQLVNDVWQHASYTFTAPGTRTPATLTPASGTLATSQTFDWSNGNEAIYFHLQLGTKGPGSTDLLGTGLTTETSVTVSIPANGKKVFAVLYQLVDDVWQHSDYTFTEP